MHSSFKTAAVSILALAMSAGTAAAQDAGAVEYMSACASCHGESGKGDGPLAELMTVEVSDLTTLSAQNDGEFPLLDVIQFIDGRTGIRGHGYPMPVWGDRYKAESADAMGPYGAEVVVRGRVLSLATYLETLQE